MSIRLSEETIILAASISALALAASTAFGAAVWTLDEMPPTNMVYTAQETDAAIGSAVSAATNALGTAAYADAAAFATNGDYQATISDLAEIRAGAAKGATALQSFAETDPTVPAWAKSATPPLTEETDPIFGAWRLAHTNERGKVTDAAHADTSALAYTLGVTFENSRSSDEIFAALDEATAAAAWLSDKTNSLGGVKFADQAGTASSAGEAYALRHLGEFRSAGTIFAALDEATAATVWLDSNTNSQGLVARVQHAKQADTATAAIGAGRADAADVANALVNEAGTDTRSADTIFTALDAAATKTELNTALDNKVSKTGDTMTGGLTVPNLTVGSRDEDGSTVGKASVAEGLETTASGTASHAEGGATTASGTASHAEGGAAKASGDYSHAGGFRTTASGRASHAEGGDTTASGDYSHAEGDVTFASGRASHAEGVSTTASGDHSHAEGWNAAATNDTAFAWQGSAGGHTEPPYYSHGPGTFNINPVGGAAGFYIGETNLADRLAAATTNLNARPISILPDQTFVDLHGDAHNGPVEIGEGAAATVDTSEVPTNVPIRSVSVAIGAGADARDLDHPDKQQSIAIGNQARASGVNSLAIGSGVRHVDETDMSGGNAYALGAQAISLGYSAKATAQGAVQIGPGVNETPNSLQFMGVPVVRNGKVVTDGLDTNAVRRMIQDESDRGIMYGSTGSTNGFAFIRMQGYNGAQDTDPEFILAVNTNENADIAASFPLYPGSPHRREVYSAATVDRLLAEMAARIDAMAAPSWVTLELGADPVTNLAVRPATCYSLSGSGALTLTDVTGLCAAPTYVVARGFDSLALPGSFAPVGGAFRAGGRENHLSLWATPGTNIVNFLFALP